VPSRCLCAWLSSCHLLLLFRKQARHCPEPTADTAVAQSQASFASPKTAFSRQHGSVTMPPAAETFPRRNPGFPQRHRPHAPQRPLRRSGRPKPLMAAK
jgi:hypothetical protein